MSARIHTLEAGQQQRRRVRAGQVPEPLPEQQLDTRTSALVRAAYASGVEHGERQGFVRGTYWGRFVWGAWGVLLGCGITAGALKLGLLVGAAP